VDRKTGRLFDERYARHMSNTSIVNDGREITVTTALTVTQRNNDLTVTHHHIGNL
jgi:hypothetical protein